MWNLAQLHLGAEYGTTPNDTLRLTAAAYWMRTSTPNLLSPTATGNIPGRRTLLRAHGPFPYHNAGGSSPR